MHAVIAPVLAQLIALGVTDRTEARYVSTQGEGHYEASTLPSANLRIGWKRVSLTLAYTPSFTVVPLESEPRDLRLFHTGLVAMDYQFRRGSFTLLNAVGYGQTNFQTLAIAPGTGPTPVQPGSTTPGGSATQPPASGGTTGTGGTGAMTGNTPTAPNAGLPVARPATVVYANYRIAASGKYALARASSLSATVGYSVAGGVDESSRVYYPPVRGPDATFSAKYAPDGRNSISLALAAQSVLQPDQTSTALVSLTSGYTHLFDKRTSLDVGIGVAYARNPRPLHWNGQVIDVVYNSIYPTARAVLSRTERVARGILSTNLGFAAAPFLDFTSGVVDPRIAAAANVGWGRDRVSFNASLLSAISIANVVQSGTPGVSSVSGSLGVSYRFSKMFALDGGVRGAWQKSVNGKIALMPPTAAAFVGLTFALPVLTPH
jgi:hypothetical protein